MAISPNTLKIKFKEKVTDFENQIDCILADSIMYGDSITIDPPNSMQHAHFQMLKTRYVEAGWADVVWSDHQIGGKSITFKTTKD